VTIRQEGANNNLISMKIKVCTCEQCKFVKNKKKNRKYKKKVKRWLNKKIRKGKEGQIFNFYWA